MDRVVIITGASRGLGLHLVCKFLENGDMVFGVTRTKESWSEAKRSVRNSNQLFLYQVDLTSEKKVSAFLKTVIKRKGRIDILINNAGYGGKVERVEAITGSEFQRHLNTNLLSQFYMCKHAIPRFRSQHGGLIVNIASMAGKRAVPRLAAYSASKFGVLALSQCIAKENADSGLKCITICPGGMNTKMRSDLFGEEDAKSQQSADYVADVIVNVVNDKTHVESGGDVIIRHGKMTAINKSPTT